MTPRQNKPGLLAYPVVAVCPNCGNWNEPADLLIVPADDPRDRALACPHCEETLLEEMTL